MSERTDLSFNSGDPDARWQANLLALARALPYPATPDVQAVVMARVTAPSRAGVRGLGRPTRRAYAYVLAVILIALLALLAVPSARAAFLNFLRIGAVRIFLSPTIEPTLNRTPAATAASHAPAVTPIPTASPSPTPVLSVLDLAGQTTLDDARHRAGFTIRLPTYPPDLGQPDDVFVQDIDGRIVILVWLDPSDRSKLRLALQFINSSASFEKTLSVSKQMPGIEFTEVNGQTALWTTGPYILETRAGAYLERRLISGHVLIWTGNVLTYRLETNLSQEEAVKVAESLGK